MEQTAAARAKVNAAWGKWFQDLGKAVVDGGNPVGRAKTVAKNGAVTEGG